MADFENGIFSVNGEKAVQTNRFFRDSRVVTEFIEKENDTYNDRPSKYYKGDSFRFL